MLEGVILAGGKGERFWPLSRPGRPKQLLRLIDDESLLRTTWRRLRHRLDPGALRVVAGESLVPSIRLELPELIGDHLVPETVGRNTAPALAVAAALGARGGGDVIQLVVPCDHWIPDVDAFWASVNRAVEVAQAEDGPLVTFGIPITRPDTGYGYIERGERRGPVSEAWQVRRFHEKPDETTARSYQASGNFFWNSGIFVWRAQSFLDELARTMPELHKLVQHLTTAKDPMDRLPEIFQRAPAQSVDHGVLEHSRRVAVVAAGFPWSDVGTWERWGDLAGADASGNACHGDILSLETEGCILFSEEGVVAALGVKDLVIVRTGDVTLVVPKARSHDVRRLFRLLQE